MSLSLVFAEPYPNSSNCIVCLLHQGRTDQRVNDTTCLPRPDCNLDLHLLLKTLRAISPEELS